MQARFRLLEMNISVSSDMARGSVTMFFECVYATAQALSTVLCHNREI